MKFKPKKSQKEISVFAKLAKGVEDTPFALTDVIMNFSVYTPRQAVARFLNRYEMFKKVVDIHGSILEFGVYKGAGLFSWLHFSSILEPYNINRKIYGFDTFKGFPVISKKDSRCLVKGDLGDASYAELVKMSKVHQENIAVSHFHRMEIIKGDINKTLPALLKNNPQLIAALVYIDVDLYKPTRSILKMMLKRVPKGGIIAFDELNDKNAAGETAALLEEMNINHYKIRRNHFDSLPCYIVM